MSDCCNAVFRLPANLLSCRRKTASQEQEGAIDLVGGP